MGQKWRDLTFCDINIKFSMHVRYTLKYDVQLENKQLTTFSSCCTYWLKFYMIRPTEPMKMRDKNLLVYVVPYRNRRFHMAHLLLHTNVQGPYLCYHGADCKPISKFDILNMKFNNYKTSSISIIMQYF